MINREGKNDKISHSYEREQHFKRKELVSPHIPGKKWSKKWKLCLSQLYKCIKDKFTYNNLDLLIKILTGIVIAGALPLVSNYFERQNYYNNTLSDYSTSLEKLLIEDRLYLLALNQYLLRENDQVSTSPLTPQIKRKIWGLARANTEMTIRTLSEDDGLNLGPFSFLFPQRNPERQKLLIHMLGEAQLGFKNKVDGTKPEQELASFLEGIDLGRLDQCLEEEKDDTCEGLNLNNIVLSRAMLKGSNFIGAELNGAILDHADLREARLIEAKLNNKASLVQANLRSAYLQEAELQNANFTRANLRNANLQGTELQNANLTLANLIGANLQGTELQNVKPTQANLIRVKFNEAKLQGAKLDGILFDQNTLKDISEDNQNLLISKGIEVKPKFNREEEELNRNNGILSKLGIEPEKVFYATDLSGVDLTEANLVDNNLRGANLKNAILTEADLENANLGGADLTGADFTGANLTGVKEANLTNATLCKTTMPNGKVENRDCEK